MKEFFEKLKSMYLKLSPIQVRMISLILFLFLVGLSLLDHRRNSESHRPNSNDSNPDSMDTFIPDGFVLVPIEVANKDALSAMIGQFAVVDLFMTVAGQRSELIGKQLKLVRAPLDPNQYAVLVPDEDSARIVRTENPIWVVIQSRNANKSRVIKDKLAKNRIQSVGAQ